MSAMPEWKGAVPSEKDPREIEPSRSQTELTEPAPAAEPLDEPERITAPDEPTPALRKLLTELSA